MYAVELSLRVLGPHRMTLRALAPVMVGDAEEGVFAQSTAFSRLRIQTVFQDAVVAATDAPRRPLAVAVGRLAYLLHLGVILGGCSTAARGSEPRPHWWRCFVRFCRQPRWRCACGRCKDSCSRPMRSSGLPS